MEISSVHTQTSSNQWSKNNTVALGGCLALSAPYALLARNIYVVTDFLTYSGRLGIEYSLSVPDLISPIAMQCISVGAAELINKTDYSESTKTNIQKSIFLLGAAINLTAAVVNIESYSAYGDPAVEYLSFIYIVGTISHLYGYMFYNFCPSY